MEKSSAPPSVTSSSAQLTDEPFVKKANRILRWNLLWFLIGCLLFVPLPLWLYPVHCEAGFWTMCGVTFWSCLVLFTSTMQASYTMARLFAAKRRMLKPSPQLPVHQVESLLIHMVLMAGYKEPLEVMVKTMDSLKAQTKAKRIFAVIAFEERTPEFDEKCAKLKELYSSSFLHIMFTKHPSGVAGEIPGKCSNANYATREAVKKMHELNMYGSREYCTFTTCDTDNLFPPNYLEVLGQDFLTRKNRHEVIWQPPLFYNYDLDKRPFFVRVTGIMRGVFVTGMLIPQNINAMSVYSMSLILLEKGNFFHPNYQFVDAIDNLVRMIAIRKTVRLIMLPCPVISGPTSGTNLKEEFVEWARQAWRWTVGTAEIFHYFCIKIRSFTFFSGIHYGLVFTHYYLFVICGMALFSVTGIISSYSYNAAGVCNPKHYLHTPYLEYIPLFGIAFAYLIFLSWFVLDSLAMKVAGVKEHVCFLRSVCHWLSTPFVLVAYSAIAYFAVLEVAVRGKKVCTHGSSKKIGLGQENKTFELSLEDGVQRF